MNIHKKFRVLLSKIESNDQPTSESEIEGRIREFRDKLPGDSESIELIAESLAFGFQEDNENQTTGWGTYYGPMLITQDEEGNWIESPSIKLITKDVLEYWQTRAQDSRNPLLQARYADLVWDFSKTVTGSSADVAFATTTIDQILESLKKRLFKHELAAKTKLKRALSLALSINDTERVSKLVEILLNFEDSVAVDSQPGLWGFSFDILLANKKLSITESQEGKIIDDLETRLNRVSGQLEDSKLDPFATEAAAMRLLKYYRRNEAHDDVRRILLTYSAAFVKASEGTSPLVASSWLEKVHSLLFTTGIKEEADKVSEIIKKLGVKAREEMQTFSTTLEMSQEELEAYLDEITDGTLTEALDRVALQFVPKREEVERQLRDMAQKAPLQSFFPISIQDSAGHTVATVGALHDDLEGRIIHQTAQNMQFDSQFLLWIFDRIQTKFGLNVEKLIEHFSGSPVLDPHRFNVIRRGFNAHFQGDFLVSITILIPEVEAALRRLLALCGGSIYKPLRKGGLLERNLDEIIRDKKVKEILGEAPITYLSTLFTDQRGWNVRNRVCHGLLLPEMYGKRLSNQILHVFLLLSLLRTQTSENQR